MIKCTIGYALFLGTALAATSLSAKTETPTLDAAPQVASYARLVHANYSDALAAAKTLQAAIDAFLVKPTEDTLKTAKEAWLTSRESYGESEAFRFYEGPIDFVDAAKGTEGPEARLNSWPLNEAYIDYVSGNAKAGIVQQTDTPITKETLAKKNQAEDEADVATGYHAIEFLLWGQDLSKDTPGSRPASDYLPGDPVRERRRTYLKAVTDLLVDDLAVVTASWQSNADNYAKQFIAQDSKISLGHILTALATLSGFELASERMATSLDSGDQEDEHSCFSDNTHNDFIYNARGISNVFFGHYSKDTYDPSIYSLLKAKDKDLAGKLEAQLKTTESLMAALPHPIDREILSTPEGSPARRKMEEVIASLQAQAVLFEQAGKALGLPSVRIMSD